MRLNSCVRIVSSKTVLVPYRPHHVSKYHEWMKSEELQMLTASEPLSLEKEYEMQKTWLEDEDKCTFIILNKQIFENTCNEIESMIGDTNIFVTNDNSKCKGEIEIMIAEKSYRGKKYGWESVILMMVYCIKYIKVDIFEAKISSSNLASINMFEKLGFTEISRSEVFQEVTLGKIVNNTWLCWLESRIQFQIEEHL